MPSSGPAGHVEAGTPPRPLGRFRLLDLSRQLPGPFCSALLRMTFRQKTLAEWMAELAPLDVCIGPVNGVEDAWHDPQLRHRGMVVEMDAPSGRRRLVGPPIKLSDTPARIRTPPPGLGEHTDAVLAELGHSPAEIAALRAQGVV